MLMQKVATRELALSHRLGLRIDSHGTHDQPTQVWPSAWQILTKERRHPMGFYKKLCELGARLLDDSRRKEESVALDDSVMVYGQFIVVRDLIEYLSTTDSFYSDYITETLKECLSSGTPRAAALAAAEVWMSQAQEHLYGLGCKTAGWRLNRKDKQVVAELVASIGELGAQDSEEHE